MLRLWRGLGLGLLFRIRVRIKVRVSIGLGFGLVRFGSRLLLAAANTRLACE